MRAIQVDRSKRPASASPDEQIESHTDHDGQTARAAVGALQAQPGVQANKLGAISFSMGEEWSRLFTEWYPEAIRAIVLVYGAAPAVIKAARAAVQGHFVAPHHAQRLGPNSCGLRLTQPPASSALTPVRATYLIVSGRKARYL